MLFTKSIIYDIIIIKIKCEYYFVLYVLTLFKRADKMKTCVTTYSFGSYISDDRLGIYGVIDKAAEMGFDGIEFTDGYWTESMNVEKAKAVREYAIKKGLDLVAYCTGFDFINGSDGKLSDEIKRAHAITDFVAELGVKNMRFDVAYSGPVGKKVGISYDACLSRMAEGCREVSKIAESKGIGAMTENHGYFSQDSSRVEKLINETNHENFGALVDIGNFMCADEDPAMAVGNLAKYAKHVHAKDFFLKSGMEVDPGDAWFKTRAGNYLRGAVIGHGDAKVYQCIQILKSSGYDGYYSVEFEGIEDNLVGIELGLKNLKRFLND